MALFQKLEEDPGVSTVFSNDANALFRISKHGLFKFNFDTDTWIQQTTINKLPHEFFCIKDWTYESHHPIAMSAATKTIYFLNQRQSLAMLKFKFHENDKDNAWIIKHKMYECSYAQGIILNNEYHVIGGRENPKHFKYNETTQKMQILHDLGAISSQRLVKIKNNLLMFGGCDVINQYDASNNKWTSLKQKMPTPLYYFGCTKVLYDKYVLLLRRE